MRRSILIGRILLVLFSVVPFNPWNTTPVIAEEKPALSLYDRLGGVLNIAPVVDDFLNRLYVNKTLNANPRIKEARDRVPISYLKFHHNPHYLYTKQLWCASSLLSVSPQFLTTM